MTSEDFQWGVEGDALAKRGVERPEQGIEVFSRQPADRAVAAARGRGVRSAAKRVGFRRQGVVWMTVRVV